MDKRLMKFLRFVKDKKSFYLENYFSLETKLVCSFIHSFCKFIHTMNCCKSYATVKVIRVSESDEPGFSA